MIILLLYVLGFLCIVLGVLGNRKQKKSDSIKINKPVNQSSVIDFNQEMVSYQQKLEQIDLVNTNEIVNLIDSVKQLVNIVNENIEVMTIKANEPNKKEIIEKSQVSTPKNLAIRPEIEQKMKDYYQLKEEGKSLDEILKIIDMEKGELLFLENLYKSIT